MTNADIEDIVTTVRDGVTVEKSFEPDDFPVPAIAFTVRSERETAVSILLVESLPDDTAPENIGFHPKYGAEFWDVDDGTLLFRRDLAPDETYTTVYGLRGGDADDATKFMTEPTLESVEPIAADEYDTTDSAFDSEELGDLLQTEDDTDERSDSDENDADSPSDAANGEHAADEETDTSDIAANEDVDAIGSIDTSEPADAALSTDGDEDGESTEVEELELHETGSAVVAEHDSVVAALAAEIRDGDLDDDDLMALRDALGVDLASASVEARIEHLQSEVADLEAYSNAFEAFLDEEGDAQTLIAEAKEGHEEVADHLEDLEAQLKDTHSALESRLDAIDERIEERIDSELETIRTDLRTLEERLETEANARTEIESELERLSIELEGVAEMRDRLTNALGGLAGGHSNRSAEGSSTEADTNPTDSEDADAAEDENSVEGDESTDGVDAGGDGISESDTEKSGEADVDDVEPSDDTDKSDSV